MSYFSSRRFSKIFASNSPAFGLDGKYILMVAASVFG
jgi:hypothetical protein